MKLTKNQKHFLKTIKDKNVRKYQKQQFKLQNEFENRQIIKQFPFSIVDISFKEEFEKVNGKGFPWHEHNVKEVEERFNELAKKYMPKEDVDTFKKEIQSMISADISHLTFTTEINNGNFVFYKDNHKPFEYSGKISEMTFSDKLAIVEKIESYAEELDVNLKPKGKFIIPK